MKYIQLASYRQHSRKLPCSITLPSTPDTSLERLQIELRQSERPANTTKYARSAYYSSSSARNARRMENVPQADPDKSSWPNVTLTYFLKRWMPSTWHNAPFRTRIVNVEKHQKYDCQHIDEEMFIVDTNLWFIQRSTLCTNMKHERMNVSR